MSQNISVEEIEGIGSVYSKYLSQFDIHDIIDLVSHSTHQIHKWLGTEISLSQVKRWRAMASLMQIHGITNQYAEALVDAEISTTEDVSNLTFNDAISLFENAKQSGKIPEVPNSEDLLVILKDAIRIECTGNVTGMILNDNDAPLENTIVSIGNNRTTTNSQGRFRLLRIPLGRPALMTIEHADFGMRKIENQSIAIDNEIFNPFTISLTNDTEPIVDLDEYNGHSIPYYIRSAFTTKHADAKEVRDYDLLFIQDFYKNGTHVKIASRNKAFINGKVVIRTYKVPLNELPDGIERLDNIVYKSGIYERVSKIPFGWIKGFNLLRAEERNTNTDNLTISEKVSLVNNILNQL